MAAPLCSLPGGAAPGEPLEGGGREVEHKRRAVGVTSAAASRAASGAIQIPHVIAQA